MVLVPTITPSSGIAGNVGSKYEKQRAEFDSSIFDALIEQKGYRLVWTRAAECPCASVNDQTKTPDPNCTLCKGTGWLYFPPTQPVMSKNVGVFTPIQQAIVTRSGGGVIRGVMTGLRSERHPYNEIGNWKFGDVSVTVRPPNKLGYYDKLVHLDSEVVFAEGFDSLAESVAVPTRYLVNQINLFRSLAQVYVGNEDYTLSAGVISWVPGHAPEVGTRLTLHYLTHPTWIIIDHPHAIRASMKRLKVKNPDTPQGNAQPLPLQAHARLEFIP
jgi:hypothetical protein